jgi:hypothetical protein
MRIPIVFSHRYNGLNLESLDGETQPIVKHYGENVRVHIKIHVRNDVGKGLCNVFELFP